MLGGERSLGASTVGDSKTLPDRVKELIGTWKLVLPRHLA
jgi:hypothetical protein